MANPSQLQDMGLSENESKVYLAMLELGPASVIDISKRAGVNRPTAYVQIESLKKSGLVSTQTKGKKQLFIAESPDQLEFVLDRQLGELKQKQDEFKKILPDLVNLYRSSGAQPEVRFFEGKEGLQRMQENVLKSGAQEILAIASADQVLDIFPAHLQDYSTRRIKKGIKSRLIYTNSKGPTLEEKDPTSLRVTKFISSERMPLSGDLAVYGDSVAISSFTGKISGVIIDHPDIANSFRHFFELIWQSIDK